MRLKHHLLNFKNFMIDIGAVSGFSMVAFGVIYSHSTYNWYLMGKLSIWYPLSGMCLALAGVIWAKISMMRFD